MAAVPTGAATTATTAAAGTARGFDAESTVAQRKAIIDSIDDGTHVVPPGWAARKMTQAEAVAAIPDVVQQFATKSKRYLIGTTYSDVGAAFYKGLAIARQSNNPVQLLRDCILAVYVAYTLSRSWAPQYTAFAGASLFSSFDITGRESKAGAKDSWVTSNVMNSTAVHMLGYLIVQHSDSSTLLGRVKKDKGTPFSPPTGGGEQSLIMKAHGDALTADDRAIMSQFGVEATKLIALVNAIFGAAGADVNMALAAAKKFADTAV